MTALNELASFTRLHENLTVAHNTIADLKGLIASGLDLEQELAALKEQVAALQTNRDDLLRVHHAARHLFQAPGPMSTQAIVAALMRLPAFHGTFATAWCDLVQALFPEGVNMSPSEIVVYVLDQERGVTDLKKQLVDERGKRFAVEQRLATAEREEGKLREAWGVVRAAANVPRDASVFAACSQATKELHTWSAFRARVAGMLGCAPDADPDAMLSALGQRFKPRDEVPARVNQALIASGLDLEAEVTTLKSQLSAAEARGRVLQNELTEAQKQCAAWEVQAQDHRDRATAFFNQVSRALGAEPSSLSTGEALHRIDKGAVAYKRFVALLFPSAATSIGAAALEARIDEALTAEARMRELSDVLQQYAPDLAARAAKEGMLPVVLLIKQLRAGEVREQPTLHSRLVEALHIGRPASTVTSDQLVEWAKQTYEQRALVDRLAAALRQHVPPIGSLQSPVEVLCDLAEDGSLAEALRRDSAWEDLVRAYNVNAGRSPAPLIRSAVESSKETLLRHVKLGARLNAWLREQQER